MSSYFQASKAHLVETCDSWRQAHNSSARRIADLEAQLVALEIPAGEDSGSQTSRQDRTESQPIRGDAEESDDDDEDEEDEEAEEDDE